MPYARWSISRSIHVNPTAAVSMATAANIHQASPLACSRSATPIRAAPTVIGGGAYQGIIRGMARQAPTHTPHVSVVVLVYDEVDSVEPLHRELMGVLAALGTSFEVLFIDYGSRDGTTEKLGQIVSRDARVRVVSFRLNFGKTAVVQAGIVYSRGTG